MLRLSLCVIAGLLLAPCSRAVTYSVNPDGSGDFPTIQAAVFAASNGDIVELGDGVYTGHGNNEIYFVGRAITIRSRSGVPENCIINCEGDLANPRRGFYFTDNEGPDSELRGVTVVHGRAKQDPYYYKGGAVMVSFASPSFVNCIFRDNYALSGGGAVFCRNGSPTFINCRFENNVAGMGGGLDTFFATPAVVNCTFRANEGDLGGALSLRNNPGGVVLVASTLFEGNSASQRAGGVLCDGGSLALSGCRFIDNFAPGGGAARIEGAEHVKIERCWFEGNRSTSGPGGVSYSLAYQGFGEISDCTFVENEGGSYGGALLLAAPSIEVPVRVHGCTFYGNSAASANAIHLTGSARATIEQCILSFGRQGDPIRSSNYGLLTLICCDIFGNDAGDWVGPLEGHHGIEGNISADPLFCDAPGGEFTLSMHSPCAPSSEPNAECDLIGAHPVLCDVTPAHPSSWGGIKTLFR
jgi:hypothetical protein